jgi:hypothetical protein
MCRSECALQRRPDDILPTAIIELLLGDGDELSIKL